MSTPCIELLLARFPNAKLCLIAPKSILELFSADSRIYACFEDSTKKSKNRLKTTWQLGRAIRSKLEREGGVDIAITLTNHFYSALLLYACGARVRIGYKRGVGNMFLTHKLARAGGLHQVESYARLLDLLPQAESKTLDSSPKAAIPPLRLCAAPKQALDSKPLRIGLNPGAAYGSAKCWDKEHYARVGAHFAALGAEVVVYGVEADRELAEEIIASIDSVLGEQCGSVANFVKGTTAKVANLPQSLQSSHSPTAIPRILEESQAENETQTELESNFLDSSSPSLRDTAPAVARQSNSAQAESNQINGARKACNLESVALGLGAKGVKKEGGIRESSLPIQAPPSPLERTLSQAKLESSNTAQKVDSSVDCHADFQSARNDDENAQSSNTPQTAGFADDFLKKPAAASPCTATAGFVGCQGVGEEIYLGGNEQAHAADSRKSAAKPTPKITNACGQTTIPTLLQELQTLDLFITNDSGSMHIAAALEVPMVAIFGPTNMTETAPWRAKNCILLNLNLPCAPCKKRVCPLGHHKCMKDLRPEMVIEAAHKLLEARQASSNQAQT